MKFPILLMTIHFIHTVLTSLQYFFNLEDDASCLLEWFNFNCLKANPGKFHSLC